MPSATSAAAPWVLGGSSQTSTPRYARRSGVTHSERWAARSSSESQLAAAIAAAIGPS